MQLSRPLISLAAIALMGTTACTTLPERAPPSDAAIAGRPPMVEKLRPVPQAVIAELPDAPWYVHLEGLELRDLPTMAASTVLAVLNPGTTLQGTYFIVEQSDEEWLEVAFAGRMAYVSRIGFSRVHPDNQAAIDRHGNLPYGTEFVNRWWGIPLSYEPDDLVVLEERYTVGIETADYRLRREAAESMYRMLEAAWADGHDLWVSSGYRSGERQKGMYVRSSTRRLHQRGTAPPGHSEHQLGSTADLSTTRERRRAVRNTDPVHAWLIQNAGRFGWRQTYLADNTHETGYIEEPWHWRYMGNPSR